MAERLFRKTALDGQSSAEDTALLVPVTSPKGWLALAGIGGLLLGVLAWGFFGTIPVNVSGQGILMGAGGVYEIVSTSAGEVKDVYFEVGETIEKGRTVARIEQAELLRRIREASATLQALRGAAASGDRVRLAESALQALRAEFDASSRVTSMFSGRILELLVRPGEIAAKGTPLMRVELAGTEIGSMEAVLYFSAGAGGKIRQGMSAEISPLVAERSEYGFLPGLVTRVSEYPSSAAGMERVLQNETLVQSLSRDGAPIAVYVDLIPDPDTPGGYKWSSARGPDVELRTGALCTASVTVARQRPIDLLVPLFKKDVLGIR